VSKVILCQKLFCVKINFVTKGYMYVVSSRATSKFPGYWGRNGHFLVEIWLSLTDKKSLNCTSSVRKYNLHFTSPGSAFNTWDSDDLYEIYTDLNICIDGLLSRGIAKDRIFGYSSSSQFHTVFICCKKNHRDSTMVPVTDAETVVDGEGDAPTVRGRGKPLENGQRNAILQALLSHTKNSNSKLQHGAVGLVAKQFKVSRVTVHNIWKRGKESVEDGTGAMVVLHRKKNCGRKLKDYSQQIANMTNIPLNERTCY
jgi:hypothetical protein